MITVDSNIIGTLIAMAGFALATSASPGPVNIVSAMSGAKFGALRTVPYVLGATIGFVSILAIVGSGLGPVITRFPRIEQTLAILGSIYMLYLAYKLAGASLGGVGKLENQSPPTLLIGVLAQYTNPKAWIVSVSAVSIYVSTSQSYKSTLIVFCLIFFVVCFPSLLAWSVIGASFSQRLRALKLFNLSMALLLVFSIVVLMIEFFR